MTFTLIDHGVTLFTPREEIIRVLADLKERDPGDDPGYALAIREIELKLQELDDNDGG